MTPVASHSVREAALQVVQQIDDDATWDDLQYRLYVRQKIEAGLADVEAGRVSTTIEVMRSLGVDD